MLGRQYDACGSAGYVCGNAADTGHALSEIGMRVGGGKNAYKMGHPGGNNQSSSTVLSAKSRSGLNTTT